MMVMIMIQSGEGSNCVKELAPKKKEGTELKVTWELLEVQLSGKALL